MLCTLGNFIEDRIERQKERHAEGGSDTRTDESSRDRHFWRCTSWNGGRHTGWSRAARGFREAVAAMRNDADPASMADPVRDLLAFSMAPSGHGRPAARCASVLEQPFPDSGGCGHHLGRRAADALRSTPSDLQVEQAAAMAPVTCPVSLPPYTRGRVAAQGLPQVIQGDAFANP